MTFIFEPAVKAELKGRLAIEGPAGSGKTWTALTTAAALAAGGRVAVIDTLRRQSLHYANLWKFDVLHMTSFHPNDLVEALGEASGYDVCVVDSGSSFWSGPQGMLDQVDALSVGKPGSAFNNGWKEMKPVELRMLEALMNFPGHLIMTLKVKSDYVVERNEQTGKHGPKKVGLKPDQREGLDYEFDVIASLDVHHTMTITKTHCPEFDGKVIERPDEWLGTTWLTWLQDGEPVQSAWDYRDLALDLNHTSESLKDLWREVMASGRGNTPMVDELGNATTLIQIINRRGKELASSRGGTS